LYICIAYGRVVFCTRLDFTITSVSMCTNVLYLLYMCIRYLSSLSSFVPVSLATLAGGLA